MSGRQPTQKQLDRFLEHLAETLNVTGAAKVAGIGRSSVYRLRDSDATFGEAWGQAVEQAIDELERVAVEIAMNGCLEETFDETGRLVSSRRRQDSGMVRFLLSAHRPATYSEKTRSR